MTYDYSRISDYEKTFLPEGFSGNVYNLSYKWMQFLPKYNKAVKILEIGAYHGANACSLVKTLATHKNSEVHCCDPWLDSEDYVEYKGEQSTNYSLFLRNISKLSPDDLSKIYVHRMSSADLDTRFADQMFDIIYVDGNHSAHFVMQDAILSLKKLAPGGFMIFDDLQDPEVVKGVNAFMSVANDKFEKDVKSFNCQLYLQKLK
jgi:predicted O-methyltransferase YrrM